VISICKVNRLITLTDCFTAGPDGQHGGCTRSTRRRGKTACKKWDQNNAGIDVHGLMILGSVRLCEAYCEGDWVSSFGGHTEFTWPICGWWVHSGDLFAPLCLGAYLTFPLINVPSYCIMIGVDSADT
jgi:hypothetical protein